MFGFPKSKNVLGVPKFRDLIVQFEHTLCEAQKERKAVYGQGVVTVPDLYDPTKETTMLQWNIFELHTMEIAVNEIREKRNRPKITFADIRKIETKAIGHSDYTHKLALYCADLALETL